VVGSKKDLEQKIVVASEVNLFPRVSDNVSGKVRYRQKEEPCVYKTVNDSLQIEFLHLYLR